MERSRTAQLVGSLLVALLIVAATIAVVTARFGSTSSAELEREEERLELLEERQELRDERLEKRSE